MSWKEEFDNKFGLNGLHARPVEYMEYEDVSEEVKQFITDLRKNDEEALIRIIKTRIPYLGGQSGEDIIIKIFKDYYNKDKSAQN